MIHSYHVSSAGVIVLNPTSNRLPLRIRGRIRSAISNLKLLASGGRGIPFEIGGMSFRVTSETAAAASADYESGKYEGLMSSIKPGSVVMDIGAHHGLYTLGMAGKVGPGGTVISFEPCPDNLRVLRKNIAINSATNVRIEAMAVTNQTGISTLWVDESDLTSNALNRDHEGLRPVPVETITLDDFCRERRIRPAIIKIDAEGEELAVLQGAAWLLAEVPEMVLHVEVHETPGLSLRALADFVRDQGYGITGFRGEALTPQDMERGGHWIFART
jgi:FkbM family methyltransferase